MYGTQTLDAGTIETLQGTNPQFEVGVYGVLYQYRHIHAFKCIGKGLHGKGVGGGSCTYPQDIDAVFKCQFHMFGSCHLGGGE